MTDSLKKGIATKYLLPIVVAYASAAGLLGYSQMTELQLAIQNLGVASITGVALLVFQDLIPRAAKEVLVFWRLLFVMASLLSCVLQASESELTTHHVDPSLASHPIATLERSGPNAQFETFPHD